MSLRFVLYLLSIWFLVRFVSGYLLPLFRTGLRMREDLSRSRQAADATENRRRPTAHRPARQESKPGEYIDFEEIK